MARNVSRDMHISMVGITILTVFCGRRRYLALLMCYVGRMLDRGIIDECHLWDYTRDLQDHKYLVSIASAALDGRIKVVQVSSKATFGEYYQFYAKLETQGAIVIKADDDIVYIDVDAMPAFLAYRFAHPEHLLVFPMTINNGLCAHHMQLRGTLPSTPHLFELCQKGFETLVSDGAKAAWLHDWFLSGLANSRSPSQSPSIPSIVHLPLDQRISINMFAILAKDLHLLARPEVTRDDENYLTEVLPGLEGRSNVIFAGTVVSHFGFGPQRDSGLDGEVEQLLLARYGEAV